jgi:hypothetical protein
MTTARISPDGRLVATSGRVRRASGFPTPSAAVTVFDLQDGRARAHWTGAADESVGDLRFVRSHIWTTLYRHDGGGDACKVVVRSVDGALTGHEVALSTVGAFANFYASGARVLLADSIRPTRSLAYQTLHEERPGAHAWAVLDAADAHPLLQYDPYEVSACEVWGADGEPHWLGDADYADGRMSPAGDAIVTRFNDVKGAGQLTWTTLEGQNTSLLPGVEGRYGRGLVPYKGDLLDLGVGPAGGPRLLRTGPDAGAPAGEWGPEAFEHGGVTWRDHEVRLLGVDGDMCLLAGVREEAGAALEFGMLDLTTVGAVRAVSMRPGAGGTLGPCVVWRPAHRDLAFLRRPAPRTLALETWAPDSGETRTLAEWQAPKPLELAEIAVGGDHLLVTAYDRVSEGWRAWVVDA